MLSVEGLREKGVNVEEGLGRCLTIEGMYLRLVKKVLTDGGYEKLREAIAAGNLDGAFAAAHSLKGSTGNLSLTPLYDSLVEITELLRGRMQLDYSPYVDAVMKNRDALAALCDD